MKTGTAGCGLTYAIKRSHSSVGYCALSIKCGTRNEKGYHNGVAHFVEHTLFKGTEKKSSSVINSYLDKLGGELNAYTTKEEIVLHATVLKEDLHKAAGLLFEIATSATFPQKEIETEKGVVIDEIASYKDSPADDVYDRFEEMLFEGHPLSGLILGTAASVKKIDSAELRRFVGEHFVPERMAFTVVVDDDEDKVEKWILKVVGEAFPGHQGVPAGVETVRFDGPVQFDKTVNKRNHQANCILGSTAPSLYEDPDRVVAILLSNILGGPASNSILNAVLREKHGWVYGVECAYTQYAETGIMTVSLGCDRENLDKCIEMTLKEIEKLKTVPLSPARLKAAKKQLLGQLAISGDNGETQCLSMGKSLLAYGHVDSSERTRELVNSVTSEQLMASARTIFAPDRLCRLIYL